MNTKNGSTLGGALLVAGTCIGAGMIGVPVSTAAAGLYPTLITFFIVWTLMTFSALAYLEISLCFPQDTNLITIVEKTMGRSAKIFAWIVYILFLYSLMAAYTAGGTTIVVKLLNLNSHDFLTVSGLSFAFALPFAYMVYRGTLWVDHLNRVLMLGLISAFVLMCVFAYGAGNVENVVTDSNPQYLIFTLPLLITSFGYHLLIPSLNTYMQGDPFKCRLAIIIGSLIPLVAYALWQVLVMYLIPTWGNNSLVEIFSSGYNPADSMVHILNKNDNVLISKGIGFFSFFALTSSFLGVSLGIFDFFSDGLHISKDKRGRLILATITFLPPVIYALVSPQGFLKALKYAGLFASILLILFPVVLAWVGRYKHNFPNKYKLFGGKAILLITFIFGILVMLSESLELWGMLPTP